MSIGSEEEAAQGLAGPGGEHGSVAETRLGAATVPAAAAAPVAGAPTGLGAGAPLFSGSRRWEFLYFALRNKKLMFGLTVELVFVVLAVFGPEIAPFDPNKFVGPPDHAPSGRYLLGTTYFGQDVFSQLFYGLRDSYLVGFLGALFAAIVGMAIGFTAGYRGGVLDEVLQVFTNIVVMIPSLVLLIVISAYLKTRGVLFEGVFIGVTTWPWVARAVRAQTFTLRERDFVDLAKLSGRRATSIIMKDIAPNMASYLFLVLILLFGSSILLAANFDFLGLGPTNTISLGTMMNQSMLWDALQLHVWWWFIPPGVVITVIVAALLIANVGLDEVFNPRLRET
ncbi:MAG TPA: ABC transporter permease [Acidimicrobiales bacterium]|nr:ABC transporter permease [Acidimicrobiales bacterium]